MLVPSFKQRKMIIESINNRLLSEKGVQMQPFTVDNVKQLLRSRAAIEAELLLIKADAYGYQETAIPSICKDKEIKLERQLKQIDSLFAILTQDENFVIRRHLMEGIDWFRILKEHTDTWGSESEKTTRSYQINQSKGLKKIAAFINEHENSELFREMLRNI